MGKERDLWSAAQKGVTEFAKELDPNGKDPTLVTRMYPIYKKMSLADIEAKGDTPQEKAKDYSIKKLETKISAISTAWKKMQDDASKAEGKDKEKLNMKASAIEKNLNLAKEELTKLKSGSSTPNESFEDFESGVWAIDFILERVQNQMEEYQFLIVE